MIDGRFKGTSCAHDDVTLSRFRLIYALNMVGTMRHVYIPHREGTVKG